MSRVANTGVGLMLIVGSIAWLLFFGLIAAYASAFGADGVFWPTVLVLAIAAGVGSFAAGFHTALGDHGARWSLIVIGGLWTALWALDLPYLDDDRTTGDWVLSLGNFVVGVAGIAAGVCVRKTRRNIDHIAN